MRNRWTMRVFGCLGTIGVAAVLVGCPQESDTRTASLSFTGLEPLGEGFTYEGWLVQGNDAVSTGRFNIDAEGNASPATSTVSLATADAATAFVVTIEPTTDDEPGPSDTKVLAGDLSDGAADLTVSHPAALGSDFGPTAASGAYILAAPTGREAIVSLSFTGLEPLGNGFTYEGWLVQGNDAVSAGRFNIDEDGNASPAMSMVSPATADGATAYVVTIEPTTDDEPGPSNTKVLAGDLSDGAADLTVSHPAALGSDFGPTVASGTYILATPTTAPVDDADDDYAQGIWWLDAGDPPTASLVLPTLPDGWTYEGWVVGADGPVSTGRFTAVDAADDDGAGTTAGPEDAPPFPGQDFIDPPTVLTAGGVAAVISVEPVPDDSPAPFAIKPLVDPEIEDFGAGGSQSMENNSGTAPTGRVEIETVEDYAQGIWWLDPGDPPTASLVLPTLPDGWTYEGWIVVDDVPVSTGRFTAVDAADDDGAGTTAGPEDAPPFPGQDFIDPPTVLTAGGVAAVISVEPVPDDSPGPFAIKPLVDPEIEDFGAGGSQSMENNSATLPTGSVVIE